MERPIYGLLSGCKKNSSLYKNNEDSGILKLSNIPDPAILAVHFATEL